MAVNTKAIKGRIKSVKNTKKITKAMEMVAAAKMRRAVDAAVATREYAQIAKELLDRLAYLDEPNTPITEMRPVKKMLTIMVSSNRGLCGSFNSNLFKTAKQLLSDTDSVGRHRTIDGADISPEGDVEIDILGIGKKSALFAKREGYSLVELYDTIGERPSFDEVLAITGPTIEKFNNKEYDKVVVVYTNYVNSLTQVAKVRQLLPVSAVDIEKMIEELGTDEADGAEEDQKESPIQTYFLEPTLDDIIEYVLPRLVETQLFQAVLESAASEHSARMMAMKNASENAGELIKELTLTFNKARQAAITQEIAEIAGGAAALE